MDELCRVRYAVRIDRYALLAKNRNGQIADSEIIELPKGKKVDEITVALFRTPQLAKKWFGKQKSSFEDFKYGIFIGQQYHDTCVRLAISREEMSKDSLLMTEVELSMRVEKAQKIQ